MKMWDIEELPFEDLEIFVGMKTRISIEGIEGIDLLVATGILEFVTWSELSGEEGSKRAQFFFKGRGNEPLLLEFPTEGMIAKIGSLDLEPKYMVMDL